MVGIPLRSMVAICTTMGILRRSHIKEGFSISSDSSIRIETSSRNTSASNG
eukprot:CAMPEP_0172833394 /NCGR_PEP_ID=MMETSP1075-20121228/24337_1 /TAXON_ID=2916 /ORGANISM="Ceratium fusus, Strain PA161109" /LENGTH=50 /DNA_ID=CAMNT_0013676135 /DNA_START=560 /DNA_END=709 /DNA_ORIENTATION=-